eukprot:GHVL01009595.1.p1 GENE.GHVL01009595.1~~GHVL01009595.1.p1  ORF type:complete len:107 (-),score=19.58 GHVL01009595.1:81-401(-)
MPEYRKETQEYEYSFTSLIVKRPLTGEETENPSALIEPSTRALIFDDRQENINPFLARPPMPESWLSSLSMAVVPDLDMSYTEGELDSQSEETNKSFDEASEIYIE